MNEKEQILLEEKRKYNLPLFLYSKEKKLLEKNIPIQQIIGYVEFLNTKILVNKDVLIPRYETEELVDFLLKNVINKQNMKILDLCSGSGFIGLAIKKNFSSAVITLSEISYKAIKVIKKNIKLNFKSKKNIKVIKSNLFKNIKNKFDLIVSNPPYLYKKDKTISKKVIDNEPNIALFAPEKGFKYYRLILEQYKKYLNKNGIIAFEINPFHVEKWKKIKNVQILKDINGKDRFVILKEFNI
ncbi:peptide chain release factor N(5)-glutamine methyltransferase [Mycoplasmopsis meleagridis]|uniref:peptide chain release factor N(5)-glutamine methyltransferase n=1 Tax=Mycoplasmopsis meleagridis TaxID=29561 RepID=UPI00073D7083|nr:peptide chain release factor N(5)-glutamine methyltransferase [Mycoplasmopsis meleagridis]KUH47447.1 SAM-dependent methyltransferase [Mycoplasmopsis meleagridis]